MEQSQFTDNELWLSAEKKMHNLKVENYVLFGDITENCRPDSSDSSEELFQRGKGGARIHRSFC